MTDPSSGNDSRQLAKLRRLKREALARRAALLEEVGPRGRTPLLTVRVIEQEGGPRQHVSSEDATDWIEPDRLYLARFQQSNGLPDKEVCVEEDDALRWAFALGWGET